MISSYRINNILIIIFFINFFGFAQENSSSIEDSLKDKSYRYFFNQIRSYESKDNYKANIYTRAYLSKAEKNKDTPKIALAYYYLSRSNNKDKALVYIDSALVYNKDIKSRYEPYYYIKKASLCYLIGNYKEALDNYIKARNSVQNPKQSNLFQDIEYSIGLLKVKTRDFEEAHKIFEKYYNYLSENKLQDKYLGNYVNTLSSLSITSWHKKELDSAFYYNNIALKASKKNNDTITFIGLKISEAIYNHDKGYYRKTIDSIKKYTKDNKFREVQWANVYLYQGKAYLKLKTIDSEKNKSFNEFMREAYVLLRNHYKKENDLKNELQYLNKLLRFDSILYDNSDYLKTTLYDKYEIPKLVKERDQLITDLKVKGEKRLKLNYSLSGLAIIFLVIAIYYYRKKIVYKKRFKRILEDSLPIKNIEKKVTRSSINISKTLINEVLEKIKIFENQKEFIRDDITLNNVAKLFDTNSNYLSKIINTYKHKNFSTYISDLRIEYAIQILKENPQLRKYTIKAIAFEVGFKNSMTFANAFYNNTGIYPSYFIKELQKQELT